MLPNSAPKPTEAVIKTEEAKRKAADRAELLNQTVRVPEAAAADEEVGRCPICKELFKNEYSEDEEDWVWRNAVAKDGKVRFWLLYASLGSSLLICAFLLPAVLPCLVLGRASWRCLMVAWSR